MSENLVDIPLGAVLNWINVPSNSSVNTTMSSTVYNNVDLRCVNKIQIEYTRSYKDHIRSFVFFILRVLVIVLVPLYCIHLFNFNLGNFLNTKSVSPASINVQDSSIISDITPVSNYFSVLDWLLN